MRKFIYIISLILLINCTNEKTIVGVYVCKDAIVEEIEFNGDVAVFDGIIGRHMPACKYEVKDKNIYINCSEGIMSFEILDDISIKGTSSVLKEKIYIKK